MEIRKLEIKDAEQFCNLIVNMYSNLGNLEWFTPMPYDAENVAGIIANPRFYIIGAFIDEKLVGVSSLDYKCGKLLDKIEFPKDCDLTKLVEIAFNIVHTDYRGNKIMQEMVCYLLDKIKKDGYKWAFAKVHKNNIASIKSCENSGFEIYCKYEKPVDKQDFISLSNQPFFCKTGKQNADKTLKHFQDSEKIIVDYNILMKKL